MANLLGDEASRDDFPTLDPEQLLRFESRLRNVARLYALPGANERLGRRLHSFDASLEELQSDASLIGAFDLLDGIERQRRIVLAESSERADVDTAARAIAAGGEIVCHWPGRSLSTGEANLASRGLFDLLDRPPLALWLEAVARPTARSAGDFEVAILAWIPGAEIDRARAGCLACGNGALAPLASTSEALSAQLEPILESRNAD